MIFYFSATGNSAYIAHQVAQACNDSCLSISDCIKEKNFSFSKKFDSIGIVSPTYAWGLPILVQDFLKQVNFKADYIYFIASYGTTPGQTNRFTDEILQKKGLSLSASFSVKMPDTWTPIFNLSHQEKVNKRNVQAKKEIQDIIKRIQKKELGNFSKNQLPYPLVKIFHPIAYQQMRKTKHFLIEDSCIACGLCAKNCPVSAIEMKDHKPIWIKEQCVMCLSCLHHCPKFAIQYGHFTKKHGQYHHSL